MASLKDLYELGETPPAGHVPRRMYASVIRPQRYGQPRDAFEVEVVDVPKPGPRQVLTWGARVFAFDQIGQAHQMLHENTHPSGNLAVRVNATDGS